MCIGRLERFSPERCRASLSMERMSPTSSRRLARRRSRKNSSSLGVRPARFLPGLLRGGGGGGMIVGTDGVLDLPLADFTLPLADRTSGTASVAPIEPGLGPDVGVKTGLSIARIGAGLVVTAGLTPSGLACVGLITTGLESLVEDVAFA